MCWTSSSKVCGADTATEYRVYPLPIEPHVSAAVVSENTIAAFHIQTLDWQLVPASVVPSSPDLSAIAGATSVSAVGIMDIVQTLQSDSLIDDKVSTKLEVPKIGIAVSSPMSEYGNAFIRPQASLFVSYSAQIR
jgi:hypothetical protein